MDTKTPRIGSEGEHGGMASRAMEHGKAATTPSHEMGGGFGAGHGK